MKTINALLLSLATALTACSSLVPVAVTCPAPPLLPEALKATTASPLTEQSLSDQYNDSMNEFRLSLPKAMRKKPNLTPR